MPNRSTWAKFLSVNYYIRCAMLRWVKDIHHFSSIRRKRDTKDTNVATEYRNRFEFRN